MIFFLTVKQVIELHDEALKMGGASGIRDIGGLESAVAMPEAQFGGEYFHPTLCEMAAAYLYHIVKNHPFIDGNKRTGAGASKFFLRINKVNTNFPDKEFEELVVGVADNRVTKAGISYFFEGYCA